MSKGPGAALALALAAALACTPSCTPAGGRTDEAGATPLRKSIVIASARGLAAAWLAGLTKRAPSVPVTGSVEETSPGGSLPTWIAVEKGAPAFELECGGDARLDALHQVPPDRALLDEYRERHADALASVLVWLAARPSAL